MRAIYKCRLCGELIKTVDVKEIKADNSEVLTFGFDTHKVAVNMRELHACDDKQFGLADFQGLIKEEND